MNREGQELVEFFTKWENHKILYKSQIGQHKTELDLLVVRRQQMWRVLSTQHKTLVFVVHMQKRREE